MDIFGIKKFLLKLALIIGAVVVLVCLGVTHGCTPNNGTDLKQNQMALATKNNVDSSQEDNRQDNSIALELPELEVVGPQLPPPNTSADEVVKLVNARGDERVKIIDANGDLQAKVIRAEEEKWRILAYGVVAIVALLSGFKLYLMKSPWDDERKEKA